MNRGTRGGLQRPWMLTTGSLLLSLLKRRHRLDQALFADVTEQASSHREIR